MVRPRKESQTASPRLSAISARFLRDGTPLHHPVADHLVRNIRALPTEALDEEPSPDDKLVSVLGSSVRRHAQDER